MSPRDAVPSAMGVIARLAERVPELLVLAWLASVFAGASTKATEATEKMSGAVSLMATKVEELASTIEHAKKGG